MKLYGVYAQVLKTLCLVHEPGQTSNSAVLSPKLS